MRLSASLPLASLALASLIVMSPAPAIGAAGGATPPMGWNSWNYFAEKVTDKDIRAAADQLVSTGMKDAGYIYVNIDDTWEGERDANGVLHTNSKFPDMKALADYVHSKGLKIGIYSGPDPRPAVVTTGSLGHEEQDAKMYAAWGIDYLKYDLCSFIRSSHGKAGAQRQSRADAPHGRRLREDGQRAQGHRPAHRLLPLPVRMGLALGVGARPRRQLVAHHRRHQRPLGPHLRHPQPAGGSRGLRRSRPLERSRHARSGQRRTHPGREPLALLHVGHARRRPCLPATTCPT